jgi:peptidoglycan/xylan/chitin deacetylase (PgdA/CDA1 family)
MPLKQIGIPVLMYHSIVPILDTGYHRTVVSEAQFRAQMQWLHQNDYRTIGIKEANSALKSGKNIEKRVVITFDDGYQSCLHTAAPILKEYGFCAMLFLCTESLETGNHPVLLQKAGGLPPHDAPLMATDLQALLAHHWEIAPHSVTHAHHGFLNSDQVNREMTESRETVEKITEKAPLAYAFPFGGYGKIAQREAKKQFKYVFTTHQGLWQRDDSTFRIPRIEVRNDENMHDFVQKMRFGYRNRFQQLLGFSKSWLRRNGLTNRS